MEVSSILNWVIAISLIGMVFGYFVLVLSTQRHNPVSWIGLTAMGLIATVAAVVLIHAQVHSVDVVRSGGFLWILFLPAIVRLLIHKRESKISFRNSILFQYVSSKKRKY
jgi:predicted tellurium resistance membrane protein TerC